MESFIYYNRFYLLMPKVIQTRRDGITQVFNISPLRPKIKELYSSGMSSRKVGKILGISHARVLQLLKKEKINRRSVTKPILNTYYKELTPERAFILGVMCGDGCIFSGIANKKQWQYPLYIIHLSVRDKDFIDEFIRCIKIVYGIKPALYFRKRKDKNPKWSDIWIAKITRKEVYNDLSTYNFGTHNWKVPQEITCSNNEKVIGAFLKGFYDSEGSVLNGKRSFGILVSSANIRGLEEVKSLLKKLNIESSKIGIDKRRRNHIFYFPISKKDSIVTFLNKVGFSIQRKSSKIKDYLNDKN